MFTRILITINPPVIKLDLLAFTNYVVNEKH